MPEAITLGRRTTGMNGFPKIKSINSGKVMKPIKTNKLKDRFLKESKSVIEIDVKIKHIIARQTQSDNIINLSKIKRLSMLKFSTP